ncbi:hypothetical protein [Wolbachia endosymbiont of Mansonella ozzardi]|uniref:hypothetical protein n=1 Tax=Wolbachia endosymbiont of Mansonella ozzardi TaxID=137464 RepID=UPI001CE13F3D|nr:hypothetical protein [Wolbachia endosymbiont of Mansonella ozzardi]
MPDQLFAELLNNLDAKKLKDIIHKLPYEKVISVADQSGNQNQFGAVIKAIKESFVKNREKCFIKLDEVMKMLKELGRDKEVIDDEVWKSSELSYKTANIQSANAEPIVMRSIYTG